MCVDVGGCGGPHERQNSAPNQPSTVGPMTHTHLMLSGLQQKKVSFMVANLLGVNAMAEEMGVDLADPLSAATEAMVTAVRRNRGTVLHFSGLKRT